MSEEYREVVIQRNIALVRNAALEAENEQLRERTRWIPVGERLPEKDEIVFVLLNGGDGDDIDWVDDTGTWWSNENVTHWMPRPEEPKEDE